MSNEVENPYSSSIAESAPLKPTYAPAWRRAVGLVMYVVSGGIAVYWVALTAAQIHGGRFLEESPANAATVVTIWIGLALGFPLLWVCARRIRRVRPAATH